MEDWSTKIANVGTNKLQLHRNVLSEENQRQSGLIRKNFPVFCNLPRNFPGEDPTGKIIVLNDDKKDQSFIVGGVMEDFKPTSHLQFDFFITLSGKEFWGGEQTSWCCWNYNPYISVREGTDAAALEEKLLSIKKVYIDYLVKEKNQSVDAVRKHHKFRLQPVSDVHLYSDGIGDIIPHGDIRYIWMFGGIAVFILALACINFINLSTARWSFSSLRLPLFSLSGPCHLQANEFYPHHEDRL